MTTTSNKIQALLKVKEEISHEKSSTGNKVKSLYESGTINVEQLLKMKRGPLTTIKLQLPLDLHPQSDCIFTFRLLTARESFDILDELKASNLSPYVDKMQYDILNIALTLSAASKPIPSQLENPSNSPELSVNDLMNAIDTDTLLALGYKYLEFQMKNSPPLESLTDADITMFVNALAESEDDAKKFDLLNGLNLRQMQEVIISLVKSYSTLIKQVDNVFTG